MATEWTRVPIARLRYMKTTGVCRYIGATATRASTPMTCRPRPLSESCWLRSIAIPQPFFGA